MGQYPNEYGKTKKGVLPDILGPLNVDAEKGDRLVPQNDMGEVGGSMCKGTKVPDPNDFLAGTDKQ